MQGLFYILSLIVLAALSNADSIDFVDCGSNAIIYEVSFEGCEESPCEAYRGTTEIGAVIFESGVDSEYADCKIYGIIDGVTLEFPGGCSNVDACLDFEEGCPIEAGEVIHYHLELAILQTYPTGDVVGRWTLLDDKEDIFLCFEVDIVIV